MEEAFEIYIADETYGIMAFKIKMLKLKILGTLLDAEYKGGDDKYTSLDPRKYPQINKDQFDTYMSNIINGDGKYDEDDGKLAPLNVQTLRLIKVINFISSGFKKNIKDTLKINYTPPLNPPTNETALYISQLKLIIGFYEDALASLEGLYAKKGELTTTGVGAKKFLYGTRWYNRSAYTPLSVTDNEQRYRHAIFKRYMSIVRKYDEIMLKEISVRGGGSVDPKLLEAKNNFLTAFDTLRDPSKNPKREDTVNALELLDAYNKKVEAAYVNIKQLGGAPVKYKYAPTGDVAYILYNKKRIKRNIYVKVKGRPTKYCKINKEYVLLSKLRQLR